jgi:hypothetical protein
VAGAVRLAQEMPTHFILQIDTAKSSCTSRTAGGARS